MQNSLVTRMRDVIWARREAVDPGWKTTGLRALRTVSMLVRDLVEGQLTLRAMSLVYTTLLSIVPLLALSFSVLKAFGVSDQLQPVLQQLLEPLGDKGVEINQRILGFIENINVGVLGALGLGLLLYTAISLMQKIEESLNFIWHIQQPRRFGERFSRYLSVLLVGPLLVFSAIGLTATVMNIDTVRGVLALGGFAHVVQAVGRLMPYLLVIAAFTFVYLFIPNTRVHLGPALIGGLVGGIAWQTAGWAFALFVSSSNSYSAIYSSFAIVILFMIWLYVCWLVLLFGASVAFYVQRPEYLYAGSGEPRLSNRVRERLALSMMSLVATRFMNGLDAPTVPEFTRAFGVPSYSLQGVLDALRHGGLLMQTDDDPPRYLPARDPGALSVASVLATVRSAGEDAYLTPAQLPAPTPVEAVLRRLDSVLDEQLASCNISQLAERPGAGVDVSAHRRKDAADPYPAAPAGP